MASNSRIVRDHRRQTKLRGRGLLSVAAAASSALALLHPRSAHGGPLAWDTSGNANANFSGANWSASTTPAANGSVTGSSGTNLYFGNATTTSLTNDLTNATFGNSSSTPAFTFLAGGNAAFIIGSNSFTLAGNITNLGTNLQTINNNFSTTAIETVTLTAGGGNVTLGGNISGAGGGLTLMGSGTLTLLGSNTYTGQTSFGASNTGTIELGSASALGGTSALSFGAFTGNTLDIATSGNDTAFPITTGTGFNVTILSDLPSSGAGINHTLGAASLAGGTLNIGAGSNVNNSGTASITLASLSLTSGTTNAVTTLVPTTANLLITGNVLIGTNSVAKTLDLDGSSTGNQISGNISNGLAALSITKSNNSTWTLSGSNSYTGVTSLNGGTLQLQANSSNTSAGGVAYALGNTTELVLAANTTLQLLGNTTNTIFTTGGTPAASSTTSGIVESGNGLFNLFAGNNGSGTGNTLILANFGQFGAAATSPTFNFSSANGYNLQIGSGTTGTGTLDVFNNTAINSNTVGATLSIPGGMAVNFNSPYTLTFGGAGNIAVGALTQPTGSFLVTMTGTGTLLLSGNNTYAGATTVNSGTLSFTGANTGVSAQTISGLGILKLDYTGGASGNILASTDTLTFSAGGTLNVNSAVSGSNSQTLASLTLNAGGGTILMSNNGATSETLTFSSGAITRNAGGAVDFVSPANTTIVLTGTTSKALLGTYAYFGTGASETYAATDASGNVTAATLSTASGVNSFSSATGNYSYSSPGTPDVLTASRTANAALFALNSNQTIDLGSSGANTLTLNGLLNTGNALTIQRSGGTGSLVAGSANELVIGGSGNVTVSAPITGTGALTDVNTGTLNLSGANTYSGNTTVGTGTLSVTGSVNCNNLAVAGGAVYQTGANVTFQEGASTLDMAIGSVTAGYGYYNLASGTLTTNEIDVGGAANGTAGVFDMSGGTATSNGYLIAGRGGTTSSGLINVTGGSLSGVRVELDWGAAPGAIGELNVGGGSGAATVSTTGSATLGLNLTDSATAGTLGIANLLGNGTLTTGIVKAGSTTPTTLLNFNGGTLKATPTNAGSSFLTGITGAYVYGNGGTIDNGGGNITIGQALLAPTGNGANSNPTVTNVGSGYIGAPLVTAAGAGGVGATAYATISNGAISNIIVTNPGTGYTGPLSFTLTGGGGTGASIGTVTQTADTSGGMTFQGSGATTLTGASTYMGVTTVNNGTLALSASSTNNIASSSAISVGLGATLKVTGLTNGTVVLNPYSGTAHTGGQVLGGAGTVSGNVTVAGGAIISAGTSSALGTGSTTAVGTLSTTGSQTWGSDGEYSTKITGATGSAGTNWDEVLMSTLSVTATGTTSTTNFYIAPVATLTGLTYGAQYTWVIGNISSGGATGSSVTLPSGNLTTATNLLGTNASAPFALDTSGFTAATSSGSLPISQSNFSLQLVTGTGITGENLDLTYTATPEPGTAMLVLVGGLPTLMARRRRHARAVHN
jgi:fibronectin-binding autotransporter adhesin